MGETIIATYGGTWAYFEQVDQWGIRLENGDGAFPVSKVYKQLEDGAFDSILSFFTLLTQIGDHVSRQQFVEWPPNKGLQLMRCHDTSYVR